MATTLRQFLKTGRKATPLIPVFFRWHSFFLGPRILEVNVLDKVLHSQSGLPDLAFHSCTCLDLRVRYQSSWLFSLTRLPTPALQAPLSPAVFPIPFPLCLHSSWPECQFASLLKIFAPSGKTYSLPAHSEWKPKSLQWPKGLTYSHSPPLPPFCITFYYPFFF